MSIVHIASSKDCPWAGLTGTSRCIVVIFLMFEDSMIKSVSGVFLFSCFVCGLVSNFWVFAFALFDCGLGWFYPGRSSKCPEQRSSVTKKDIVVLSKICFNLSLNSLINLLFYRGFISYNFVLASSTISIFLILKCSCWSNWSASAALLALKPIN